MEPMRNYDNIPTIEQAYADIAQCARGSVKHAEIGGGQDMPFEAAFSNLAHAYLKDKAPSLLDYELGFQLLDRNQENTKAVGIFGFKVGTQYLYAPVFFLNGKLKGHELLYIKAQDLFVPLKENWLNYLLNRRPNVLGEGVDRNLHNLGVMPPHLFQLSRSPQKFAADLRTKVGSMLKWAQAILPEFASWATTHPQAMAKYRDMADLDTFLKVAGVEHTQSMLKMFVAWPQVKEAFNAYHDDSVIEMVLTQYRQLANDAASTSVLKQAAGQMGGPSYPVGTAHAAPPVPPAHVRHMMSAQGPISAVSTNRLDATSVLGQGEINTEPGDDIKMAKTSAVAVLTYDEVLHHGTHLHTLDAKDRDKLVKDKILVRDERPEVSVAYEVQTQLKLMNPDESGLYDVLCQPDKVERCLIIFSPYANNRREIFCTLVRLDGEKSWINVHPSRVWILRKYDWPEFRKYVEDLPDADGLPEKSNGLYMLLNQHGYGTLPFSVDRSVGDESHKSYDVYFRRHAQFGGRSDHLPPFKYHGESQGYYDRWYENGQGERITFTGKAQNKFRATGGDLYIGAGAKKLTLKEPSEDEACCSSSEPPPIHLGNALDVDHMLGTKLASLKIAATDTEVQIGHRSMSKIAALIHLIRDWDLREAQSRYLLKRAEQEKVARFRVRYSDVVINRIKAAQATKKADLYDLQKSGPSAPPMPEPYVGTDSLTGQQIPTMQMSEFNVKIPDMSAAKTDRSIYYPMGPDPDYQKTWPPSGPPMPDAKAKQQVMNASQTGQKEIFDTSMIGSLLKAVRDDNMVDKYLPDMMKGMDRLGRVLFLFYWHNEKFAERYGQADMVELEDGLRNAFEGMGDIVLFLKQRAVDAYPDELGNPDIKDVASE
jgi:hypothetical protein